jgi:hypothetical protein
VFGCRRKSMVSASGDHASSTTPMAFSGESLPQFRFVRHGGYKTPALRVRRSASAAAIRASGPPVRCPTDPGSGGGIGRLPQDGLLLVFAVRMAHVEETGLSERIEGFHYLRR